MTVAFAICVIHERFNLVFPGNDRLLHTRGETRDTPPVPLPQMCARMAAGSWSGKGKPLVSDRFRQ